MKKMLGLPSFRKGMRGHAVYLLLLSFLLVMSGVVHAQDVNILKKQVSYHASKQPLLKVLKEIRALTNVRFTYNNDVIRKQSLVTVDQQSGTLEQLLKQVLVNTGLEFAEDMGGVVIYLDNPTQAVNVSENVSVSFIIKGQVTNAHGEPLQGATVQALGSKNGTVTTDNGVFSLVVAEKEQLRVSRLGMKPVVYTAKREEAMFVKIQLDTAAQAIQEVVVNGYQKIDGRMSTASTFKLSAEQLIQPGEPSIDKMLQGKVPGLMIINSSGSVNARPTVRMRGTSTFVGNASPLWVIDDVVRPDPVDISATQLNNVVSDAQSGNFALIGSAVSGLNPYDVESITFLKDAAATAIYGVRAANGVIVVTTKRGKAGPMQVSYNTSFSFQQRPSYNNLRLMNSKERVNYSRELQEDGMVFNSNKAFGENVSYEGLLQALSARKITEAQFKTEVGKLETNNTDWFKVLFRNSFNMTHSLSLSGGAGKTTYYASFNYTDSKGAAQQDAKKLYTADLAIHSEATKRLSFDIKLTGSYIKSEGYYGNTNPLSYALTTSRTLTPDVFYPVSSTTGTGLPLPPSIVFNMQNEIAQAENTASTRSMMAAVGLNYKVAKGLMFRNTSSAIMDGVESMSAAYEGSAYISAERGWNLDYTPTDFQRAKSYLPYGGLANLANQNMLTVSMRNMLEYSRSLFKERDQVNLTLGNEITSQQIKGTSSVEPGYFPDRGQTFYPTTYSISHYSKYTITNTTNNTMSLFGTATYNINNRYVLNGTVRADGSNRFGQYSNAKFLPNYGLSGRWNVTNEPWLQQSRIVSGLAFRASFGTQGNVVSAVGPELIASYSSSNGVDDITGIPKLGIKSLPYPELRWEKTAQWNFGADLSLFENRVSLTTDYYIKRSKDLLVSRSIPYEYGIDNMYKNAGKLLNRGVEMQLRVEVLRRKFTNLSFTFINSKNFNEIGANDFVNTFDSYINGTAFIPGRPVSGFYSYAYNVLDHQTGLPLFKKSSKDAVDTAGLLMYSGQLHPVFNGGFSSAFRYKRFSMTADFSYALGGHKRLNPLFDMSKGDDGIPTPLSNANSELIHRWRRPGDELTTNIPAVTDAEVRVPGINQSIYKAYNQSDLRVVNSSFLRCRNIRFDYLIPANITTRAGVKSISTGLFISNLFTVASKQLNGQDPEIDNVGSTALPLTRQYGFNMNVNF
ncbi:SusC/RagA family TonB-linked outer membrane protein [Chitinophaga sp.]|uniref:SusC/RagA family TonB-linked outer membrane protein n=1 Tax=Chitinophaga sp. TaxID=1869181 RepID=UPI002F94964F